MNETAAPLIVVNVKGQPYVFSYREELDFETYKKLKEMAEDSGYYAANARCINPDNLAYQYTKRVEMELGIHLEKLEIWPAFTVKFRKD